MHPLPLSLEGSPLHSGRASKALWFTPQRLVSFPLNGLFVPWRLKPPVLLKSYTGVRSHREILAFNHQETKMAHY